ncbi:hypothetical protein VCHA51O444_10102 [Vibrio chagasii]|nr:hypothetical protein VCHA51O444_10102 [Vibrio chagasii]
MLWDEIPPTQSTKTIIIILNHIASIKCMHVAIFLLVDL